MICFNRTQPYSFGHSLSSTDGSFVPGASLAEHNDELLVTLAYAKETPGYLAVGNKENHMYVGIYRFQNVVLRCPTPRLHCFLSSHWLSFRFLSFMAFLIPSIQFFFGLPCALFCFGIHFNAILSNRIRYIPYICIYTIHTHTHTHTYIYIYIYIYIIYLTLFAMCTYLEAD